MKAYIGIDPGKKGAYAIIKTENGEIKSIDSHLWDDELFINAMRGCVSSLGSECVICVVESVHSLPNEGVKSSFSFGKSCGYIEGVLRALMIPYQLVPPKTWKKEWSLTNDKNLSVETCKKLYPNISLKATDRCRTDSDGLAEALLMATYAKRHC